MYILWITQERGHTPGNRLAGSLGQRLASDPFDSGDLEEQESPVGSNSQPEDGLDAAYTSVQPPARDSPAPDPLSSGGSGDDAGREDTDSDAGAEMEEAYVEGILASHPSSGGETEAEVRFV